MPDEIEQFGADFEVDRIREERKNEALAEAIGRAVADALQGGYSTGATLDVINDQFARETVERGGDEIDRFRMEQIEQNTTDILEILRQMLEQ